MEENNEPVKIKLGHLLLFFIIIIAVVVYLVAQLVKAENRISKIENKINNQEENTVQEDTKELEEIEDEEDEEELIDIPEENSVSSISDAYGDDKIFKIKDYEENGGKIILKGEEYERLKMPKDELEELVKKGTYKMPETVLFSNGEEYTVKKNYKEGNTIYDYAFIYKWNDEEMIRYIAIKKDKDTYYIDNTTENSRTWTLRGDIEYTVDKDMECAYGIEGEETDTIENVIKNKLYFGGFFKAELDKENGVSINEEVIGY